MRDRSLIVLNGRSLSRDQPTGVDQLPALVATHDADSGGLLRTAVPRRAGRFRSNIWEQFALPIIARNGTLVSLANSGPALARRHVVMIHDMSPWDHPEWFSRPFRAKTTALNKSWARTSPLVLTPSRFSADRAAAVLGIDPTRLRVIGNPHRWGDRVPVRNSAAERYVLTVSTLSTRKNLAELLAAWPSVVERHPGLRLRVVGAKGASLLSGSTEISAQSNVDLLGYVDDDELDELFLGAAAVASASVYEGFNIPLLDAVAAGVPIVASDIPVHREIYDDVAQFFELGMPDAFADALDAALLNDVADHTRVDFADRFAPSTVAHRVLDAAHDVANL